MAYKHTRIKSIEWVCDCKGKKKKLWEDWSTKCSYNSKENVLYAAIDIKHCAQIVATLLLSIRIQFWDKF